MFNPRIKPKEKDQAGSEPACHFPIILSKLPSWWNGRTIIYNLGPTNIAVHTMINLNTSFRPVLVTFRPVFPVQPDLAQFDLVRPSLARFGLVWPGSAALPQLGLVWPKLTSFVSGWPRLAPVGPVWPLIALVGRIWLHLAPFGPCWLHLSPFGLGWPGLVPFWSSLASLSCFGLVLPGLAQFDLFGPDCTICPIRPSLAWFGHIWSCLAQFEPAWSYSACLTPFGSVWPQLYEGIMKSPI